MGLPSRFPDTASSKEIWSFPTSAFWPWVITTHHDLGIQWVTTKMIDHFASVGWMFASGAIIMPDFGADYIQTFSPARDQCFFLSKIWIKWIKKSKKKFRFSFIFIHFLFIFIHFENREAILIFFMFFFIQSRSVNLIFFTFH